MNLPRRRTVAVDVGGVTVGSAHPIVVQSMTNTDTADVPGTVAQVRALHEAGSELVRVTVNNEPAAAAVPEIVAQVDVPVIGDFHYNGHLLLAKYPRCAAALAKYRINPGNVGSKRRDDNFRTIIDIAIANGKPVRIGVNWGSLDQQLQSLGLRSFTAQVTACPGCGRTTSTFFQEMAEDIQTYLREQRPVWQARYPGAERLRVAVMGCVVNGPGESKHADIGISLPGTNEVPVAPVYVDGQKTVTLKGDRIAEEFQALVESYIRKRYSKNIPIKAL